MELRILDHDSPEETLKLPAPAVKLLLRILEEMARGNARYADSTARRANDPGGGRHVRTCRAPP